MNVASLSLCKELAEFWDANKELTDYVWIKPTSDDWTLMRREDVHGAPYQIVAPDLGYLMRQLPAYLKREGIECRLEVSPTGYKGKATEWAAAYVDIAGRFIPFLGGADTPENAAVKLCIDLFKNGVLTKQGESI
jgi:hypothetical protein